ncbi:hypothetical protein [Phenylobacterium sp.]|uniref:hypothetical protein n=1 Tax=Phenylobacterium sp. TaxID=1871053 RepID=UPI0035AE05D8
MRTALIVLAAALPLAGCAQSYDALERLNHDLCARKPTPDCQDNGYVRAGARVAEPGEFDGPPPESGDLGDPRAP